MATVKYEFPPEYHGCAIQENKNIQNGGQMFIFVLKYLHLCKEMLELDKFYGSCEYY